jgi:hypothetical protein
MPETTTTTVQDTRPVSADAVLDAAAAELTDLTMIDAAELAWDALHSLATGDRTADRARCRAVILLALQMKATRDWLLCQAAEHPDKALACTRAVTCIAAAAPRELQSMAAGAAAMMLAAFTDSPDTTAAYARLGGDDTLAQIVTEVLAAQLPAGAVRQVLLEARPVVLQQLEEVSQAQALPTAVMTHSDPAVEEAV